MDLRPLSWRRLSLNPSSKSEILIVAAEASSSLYAQRILSEFSLQKIDCHFWGVGSKEMENQGLDRLGCSEDMAVVGIKEVMTHYKDIKAVLNKIVERAKQNPPKFALLLDYPEFNLKLAKELKKLNIPVIYYISPQVWAWRTSRIKIIKKYVDKMLVLFPFEKEFYEKNEMDVKFVGHPLLDEIHERFFTHEYLSEQRQKFGLSLTDKVLALMPGSRKSEIEYNLETQIKTAAILKKEDPSLKVMIFVAPTFTVEQFKMFLQNYNISVGYIIVKQEPFEMIHMADVVLTASGTATVMVGLMVKPMVIMYKLNWLTAFIFKFLVGQKIKLFGMINILLGKKVCDEFFQSEATPENLSKSLRVLLYDKAEYQIKSMELKRTHSILGSKGATERVVESLKAYI